MMLYSTTPTSHLEPTSLKFLKMCYTTAYIAWYILYVQYSMLYMLYNLLYYTAY